MIFFVKIIKVKGVLMVNRKDLENYIKNIPPAPDILKRTIEQVQKQELKKAGDIAKQDIILLKYMQNLINKPIYGFKNKITDITQIFTILGADLIYELLHHYLLSLLSPKKWHIFNLNESSFNELQANLSFYWGKVLEYEKIKDKEVLSAISLVPSAIIVCDELFQNSIQELDILSDSSIIDYEFLLYRLTKVHLKRLSIKIGKYWEYPKKSLDIIEASSKTTKITDSQTIRLGQWIHLILFYVLSKPIFINTNLNSFIKFDIDYIQPIYGDFENALGEYF